MNGIIIMMTLLVGVMIGVLFSTPIMNTTSSVFYYSNGERYFEDEEQDIDASW